MLGSPAAADSLSNMSTYTHDVITMSGGEHVEVETPYQVPNTIHIIYCLANIRFSQMTICSVPLAKSFKGYHSLGSIQCPYSSIFDARIHRKNEFVSNQRITCNDQMMIFIVICGCII